MRLGSFPTIFGRFCFCDGPAERKENEGNSASRNFSWIGKFAAHHSYSPAAGRWWCRWNVIGCEIQSSRLRMNGMPLLLVGVYWFMVAVVFIFKLRVLTLSCSGARSKIPYKVLIAPLFAAKCLSLLMYSMKCSAPIDKRWYRWWWVRKLLFNQADESRAGSWGSWMCLDCAEQLVPCQNTMMVLQRRSH